MPGAAPSELSIRRFSAATDDVVALTALLHRAYASLAACGMRFVASHQPPEKTLRRIARGECYLAERAGAWLGTITFYPADATDGCPHYDRPDVASFGQFAVDPSCQRAGIGSALIAHAEARALAAGAAELALDTAEPATDLIAFYTRRSYRSVGHAQWSGLNYRSVILSKFLGAVRGPSRAPTSVRD